MELTFFGKLWIGTTVITESDTHCVSVSMPRECIYVTFAHRVWKPSLHHQLKNTFNVLFIFETERDRHEQGRGRERGRHRIRSRPQALSCQHRARHGARTHRPRDRDLSRSRTLNRLSHPGAPTPDQLKRRFLRSASLYWGAQNIVVRDSWARLSIVTSWLHHFLAIRSWISQLTNACLSFPFCTTGDITAATTTGLLWTWNESLHTNQVGVPGAE